MEKLLNDQIVTEIKQLFDARLNQPVELLFFGPKVGCEYCDETSQLLQEVVDISDKLHLSLYDLDDDAEVASQYHVDKAPALVIAGRDGNQLLDHGIRFSGIPSGHEFSTLIHDLIQVSGRDSGLSQKTRAELKRLDKPVHLQVFVTPT